MQLTDRFDPASAWIANRPRLDWSLPSRAAPGGELRLQGRCLVSADNYPTTDPAQPVSFGGLSQGKTRVVARKVGGGAAVEVPVTTSSCYEARLQMPPELAEGEYELRAHNGLGGELGWSDPISVLVERAEPWPDDVFDVDAYVEKAGDVDAAIAAALSDIERNGGGVLRFAARTYGITRTIVVPPRTVLRGMGADLSRISAPTGRGPKGPYVLFTGDRDFAVEDMRLYSVYAAILIAAPTFLTDSLQEALRPPFSRSPARARNVAVRRCSLVQQINANEHRRGDVDGGEYVRFIREFTQEPRQSHDGFIAVQLRGDDLVVEDNTIFGGGSCIVTCGCSATRISRNRCMIGPVGHGIYGVGRLTWETGPSGKLLGAEIQGNYTREMIVEDNDITAHSERARDGFYLVYGAENCHVARNRIYDIDPTWDGEGLGMHLWSARWAEPSIEMTGPTTGRIIDPTGEVTDERLDGAMIEIVDGRGVGQLRRIIRREGDVFELDRPWLAAPDGSSNTVFTAPPSFHNITIVDNTVVNTGANIILWGCSNDVVVDGNRTGDGHCIGVWSVRLAGDQRVWGGAAFTQVINNTARTGWIAPTDEDLLAGFGAGIVGNPCSKHPTATDEGFDMLGLIFRNTFMADNAGMAVKATFQSGDKPWRIHHAGIVVESNFTRDSRLGIVLEKGMAAVERGNRSENVDKPLLWRMPVSGGRSGA